MGQAAVKVKPVEFKRMNISQLELRFSLDRITVRKRLREAEIEPAEVKAKEKIFEVTPELEAALRKADTGLDEAKRRRESANAELVEIKVQQAKGELVPMGEVVDIVQRLFGAMHKQVAVRMPQAIATRLVKAKTKADVTRIIKNAVDRDFKTLREDFEGLLK